MPRHWEKIRQRSRVPILYSGEARRFEGVNIKSFGIIPGRVEMDKMASLRYAIAAFHFRGGNMRALYEHSDCKWFGRDG